MGMLDVLHSNRNLTPFFSVVWEDPIFKRRESLFEGKAQDTSEGNTWQEEPTQSNTFLLAVDIEENESEYQLQVDLPGVPKENIALELVGNTLTISGERRRAHSTERTTSEGHTGGSQRPVYFERKHGRFERRFTLPAGTSPEALSAHFDNGVLSLTVPKAAEKRKRQIVIQEGSPPVRATRSVHAAQNDEKPKRIM